MATTTNAKVVVRTSEPPRLHVVPRFREVAGARQILWNLIRKEVKVKYTSSVLGRRGRCSTRSCTWSCSVRVRRRRAEPDPELPDLPAVRPAGVEPVRGVARLGVALGVDNANLVKKVYFPREILPLASVGATLVDSCSRGSS